VAGRQEEGAVASAVLAARDLPAVPAHNPFSPLENRLVQHGSMIPEVMARVADCDNALDWLDEYGSNEFNPVVFFPLSANQSADRPQPAAVEGHHAQDGLDFSRSAKPRLTLREGERLSE